MKKLQAKKVGLARRKRRVRAKIFGTAERPRLTVHRTNANMYAQVIDDEAGVTLASASSLKLEAKGTKQEIAALVGAEVAKAAIAAGVETVVFDRNGYLYHGRVKQLADSAREAGLKF